jgi:hypothetical protein
MAFPTLRRPAAALSVASLAAIILTGTAGAATTAVECGLFRDYVAPDALGPTDGSITFGLSGTPEVISADATLLPPTDTNLAGLAGGAPTALRVVRDTGTITSLAFAPSCTLSGGVTLVPDLFGPGTDGYTVGDRLFAPVFLMASNDGLAALIPTAEADGAQLSLTFTIDTGTGRPSAIHAEVTLSGRVRLRNNGDILVGDARIPDGVISDAARDRLREAHRLGVDGTVAVTGEGVPDGGAPGGVAMAISLAVSFETPDAPPTADVPDTAAPPPTQQTPAILVVSIVALVALAVSSAFAYRRNHTGWGEAGASSAPASSGSGDLTLRPLAPRDDVRGHQ